MDNRAENTDFEEHGGDICSDCKFLLSGIFAQYFTHNL